MCALQTLRAAEGLEPAAGHLASFRDWLRRQRDRACHGQLELVPDGARLADLDPAALAAETEAACGDLSDSPVAEVAGLLTRLAARSQDIFRGDKDAGALLDQGEGMESVHELVNSRWDTELREAGFSGNDCVVLDDDHPFRISAAIVSTTASPSAARADMTILCRSVEGRAQALGDVLRQAGLGVSWSTLEAEPSPEGDVISLLDLEEPFFYAMLADGLASFQSFVSKFTAGRGML